MKNMKKPIIILGIMMLMTVGLSGCIEDENGTDPTPPVKTYLLTVTVLNDQTSFPISGATVKMHTAEQVTSGTGVTVLTVAEGSWSLYVTKDGYLAHQQIVDMYQNKAMTVRLKTGGVDPGAGMTVIINGELKTGAFNGGYYFDSMNFYQATGCLDELPPTGNVQIRGAITEKSTQKTWYKTTYVNLYKSFFGETARYELEFCNVDGGSYRIVLNAYVSGSLVATRTWG